jgi:hypothetical protein
MNPIEATENSTAELGAVADTASAKAANVRARAVEKIRSELNIEKWPAIWQPSKSKNKPAVRTMQREVSAGDGSRIVSKVEIGYTQLGTLTTEDQKLLYVLIKLWEDGGKPDVQVFFSTRYLARMLKKKGWGTNVIQAITKSLRKLRTIPIEWVNSYFDRTKDGAVLVDRRPFTILGDLRVVERHQDGAVNSSLGYFKFDDHILANLQANYTKPVCIEEFFKLKSEIAQLVYSHVDLILSDKTRYERRSRELFDDLGLRNAEYSHMYERKRALEKALKELEGIRLSSGILRSAVVEKTNDGKDYKVSFSKAALPRLEAVEQTIEEVVAPSVVINNYSDRKDVLTLQAEELVRYFHRVFHAVESHTPLSKETAQALALVSKHGLEPSKAVVNCARQEAAKTDFQIQHFGGVLQYESRAISALSQKRAEAQRPWQPQPVAPTGDSCPRGERRFEVLTADQRQSRMETAKANLFLERPILATTWKPESKLHDRMIRSRVIRNLEVEPMDMVLLPPWLSALCRPNSPAQNLPL